MVSCFREKEITIDFPYEAKPVFYGFLGNERGSTISAFESLPLTTQEPSYLLFNGQAYLFEDGILVDTFAIDQYGVFKSNYWISASSDYRVHFTDDINTYESDEILLSEGNRITDYKLSKIEDSRKAILELNFEQPFKAGDELNLFSTDSGSTQINDSVQSSDDGEKVTIRFDYVKPILGPSFEIIGYDTIDVVKVEAKYFSFEKSRFMESRNQASGINDAGSNFHNPAWSNIENAYGYVTSYISDSLFIEL